MSWSQVNLWRTNKLQYISRYFRGEPMYKHKWLKFGARMSKELEKGIEGDDSNLIREKLEEIDGEFEHKLHIDLGGFNFLAFIDKKRKDEVLEEYKTSTELWDVMKVQAHGQLDAYALLSSLEKGKLEKVHTLLYSFETYVDFLGSVHLTGEYNKIPRTISVEEQKKFQEYVRRTAREISTEYKKYLKNLRI